MKILFLSPNQIKKYNWGHQLFRNEIGRQHDVVHYGAGFPNFNGDLNVKEIIETHCPDVELIMTYGWRYSKDFNGLGEIHNIPKIHIVVDYGGRKSFIAPQNKFFKENKYDLMFGVTSLTFDILKENTVCEKIEPLAFSVDTRLYKKMKIKKEDLILAAFTARVDVYPNREKVRRILKQNGFRLIVKRVIHQDLIRAINRCKITVASNNFVNSLNMRYTETLACGGFMLADKPTDFNKLGFINGKHLVLYKDFKDLVKKAKYYMKNDSEREAIALEGMNFVRKNHSCEVRVKEMMKTIQDKLGI